MSRFLPRLLRSVSRVRSSDFEWLILDDGSTDQTSQILNSWNHPSLRILRNDFRLGLTSCRNRLLAEAKGKYLSILDADDLISPSKISTHAYLMDEEKNIGVVWGRSLVVLPENEWKLTPSASYTPGWDLTTDYQATHSATTWRVDFLRRVGGYDADRSLVEGPDLFLKLGDFSEQLFSPQIACTKFVYPDNSFRKQLTPEKRSELNRLLLESTLKRRYPDKSLNYPGIFFR